MVVTIKIHSNPEGVIQLGVPDPGLALERGYMQEQLRMHAQRRSPVWHVKSSTLEPWLY
jgi:hypothetical protein